MAYLKECENVVALYFKAFSWHSLGGIEKHHEEPQDSQCSRQYSKHASPKVLVRKVTNSANILNKYIFLNYLSFITFLV
jgi:hypothetical protein